MPATDDSAVKTEAEVSAQGHPVQRLRHEISLRSLLTVVLLIGGVWLLTRLWPILLVITVALVLAGTLEPAVALLERRRLKRRTAFVIVFVSLATMVALLNLAIIPPLFRQVLRFIADAPALRDRLVEVLGRSGLTAPLADAIAHIHAAKLVSAASVSNALVFSTNAVVSIGYGVTSVVLALYIIAERDRARAGLYAIVPRVYHVRLARILLNLRTIVGGYMRGQLITSLSITVFVFVLLTACRVPGALALAVFAGLTDVIPFIGGILATAPAVLASTSRGVVISLVVLGTMVLYQEFESRILVPRIYGRALRLPSLVVVVALLIGGKLLGILGALLALPVAAGLMMIIRELRVAMPGDDSDATEVRARDARQEQVYQALTTGAAPNEAAAVAAQIATDNSAVNGSSTK